MGRADQGTGSWGDSELAYRLYAAVLWWGSHEVLQAEAVPALSGPHRDKEALLPPARAGPYVSIVKKLEA